MKMEIRNSRYRQYELSNGLVVALQSTPTQTIAAKLRVNYGSVHEREGEEGIAHFLEHCLVTGGSEEINPVQADEIRSSFGMFNASTNIGRTSFFGLMLREDIKKWINYISNHVFAPRFDCKRVDGERKRVLREIADDKSDFMHSVNLEFNRLFFRGHPKEMSVLGKEEIVRNADLKEIMTFHLRGYHPNNMDLILVGGLPKNIEELVEQGFGAQPKGKNTRIEFPLLSPLPKKIILHRSATERFSTENPEESSAQIFLAYLGPVDVHEDRYAVVAMNQVLGGDTSSLLFQNMGLKKGLAYQITPFYKGNYNAGVLEIMANVPAKRLRESIEAIFEEIEKMKSQRVDSKVIERIKRIVKYHLAYDCESNGRHVSVINSRLDKKLTPEQFMEGWDRVTPLRVQEVANKYLPNKHNGKYLLYIRDPLQK